MPLYENIERFFPEENMGLSDAQVELRNQQGLVNRQPDQISKSVGQIIRDNVLTLFNILNVVIFLCILLVGSLQNTLFMFIVLSNVCIGIIQEIRAKRTVEKLSLLTMPRAYVLRNGVREEINVEAVVLDDLLLLEMGNQIPADAVVVCGEAEVNESLLTGEADAVQKNPGDPLLSGSFISAGKCVARVDHVGDDNFSSRIISSARRPKKLRSELLESLKTIIRVNSLVIIPLGLLLFCDAYFLSHQPIKESVVSTAAAMIGMIPEGLMLLTSISLAVGVIKLAYRRTLVQELYCIETLSRVDVLCLDKTGTLTCGNMLVDKVVPASGIAFTYLYEAMCAFARSMEDNNATFQALDAHFSQPAEDWSCTGRVPFSSARKWSSASFLGKGTLYVGAPEILGRTASIDDTMRNDMRSEAQQGSRVLLVAFCEQETTDTVLPTENLRAVGYIVLCDNIRPEAGDTLSFFAREDVTIKLISGDSLETVSHVAQKAGVENAACAVDMSSLGETIDYADLVERYTVFARVLPDQKQEIIRALRGNRHTVAMIGDGVNDVMALREADCSVAMAAGSDAARQISQLVLLDSDFSVLPEVVMEGRRVINNITRTASLFLVKTIFSFLLALITLFFAVQYPFEPIQLSLISSLTVGIPAFLLALEPNRTRIRGRFLVNVLRNAIPGAFTIVLTICAISVCASAFSLTDLERATLCVYTTGFTGLMVLLRTCLPFNWKRAAMWTALTVAFFCGAYILRGLLGIGILTANIAPIALTAFACAYPLLLLFTKLLMLIPWMRHE